MIRLVVQGAGVIGQRHIEEVLESAEAELAAIIDVTPESHALAARHNVPWFPCFADMLAQLRPDGLIIATPNPLHLEHVLAAIAAGIPVLVEKPLADNIGAGSRLVEAVDAAGVPLLVGHHRRHAPMIARAKAIIDTGRLGRIVAVHSFFLLLKPDAYFDVPWRRALGAGPILMNLIHDVDLLRHLVGEIETVQAQTSNMVRGNPIEETATIMFRFENGALGTAIVSDSALAPWSWEHTTGEDLSYPQTDQSCYHITGTHGALSLPRLELWTNKNERGWKEPFITERLSAVRQDPLALQIAQFCRVIRGEEPPLAPGREGLRSLQVIAAIKAAAETGGTIRVG